LAGIIVLFPNLLS